MRVCERVCMGIHVQCTARLAGVLFRPHFENGRIGGEQLFEILRKMADSFKNALHAFGIV